MEVGADDFAWAGEVFKLNGVRHLWFDGKPYIGLWSDLDGPHIREAMRIFNNQDIPVRYLDGPDIPIKYKVRRIEGEPVPLDVVEAMTQASEPWTVRDRMLREIQWRPKLHVYLPARASE